jgi:transcriptional regulator with XRE-family HTH domain
MDARRGQIRDLLRAARGRIDPGELGLCSAGRRKVPGLRREDVAVLAQVSLKWYTWLEQGRDLNFSDDLLCRVSRVLRLSSCEQRYLLALTRWRSSPDVAAASQASDWVRRTVQFSPTPAVAMTLRWDIVAWNELTTRVFRDYSVIPQDERNLLRVFLTDERYQRDMAAYEQVARKLIAEFRVDFARCAGDPAFEALIAELREEVPTFQRLWNDVELWDSPRGTVVQHEELGNLYFDRISYVPEHHPSTRILLFIPGEPNTARIIATLLPAIEIEDDVRVPWTASALGDSYLLRSSRRH